MVFLVSLTLKTVWLIKVSGVLKGWDPLLNLVLEDAVEHLRGKNSSALSRLSYNSAFGSWLVAG